jgi:plasmid stability protein
MATLYVENVPDDIYQALRKRAKKNGNSMAAEVLAILRQSVPTEAGLKRRREFYERMAEFRAKPSLTPGPFASAEEMIREDRER